MPEETTEIPQNPPTKEEIDAFIMCHADLISEMVNKWLLKTGDLLKDCDEDTREEAMDRLVKQLKIKLHYL